MAENDKWFPKIAESNWWKLRKLFIQKVPSVVTTTYLSSALSMTEVSARGNIITPFKNIGILDDDGKPTELAYSWRDDAQYPLVCQSLLEKIYPQEVRDLYPNIDSDPKAINKWFMNYCRCGEPTAKMFGSFYKLLLRADPTPKEVVAPPKYKSSISARQPSSRAPITRAAAVKSEEPATTSKDPISPVDEQQLFKGSLPQLHINIQLHISPETTAEQIDKIFESMARHLKDLSV